MALGFARTLEAPDLWRLQDHHSSRIFADKILQSFEARKAKADEYNAKLESGEIQPPSFKRLLWSVTGNQDENEKSWRDGQRQKASLAMALSDSIGAWFWWGGVFKLVGDMAQILSPLLIKVREHPLFDVKSILQIMLTRFSGSHQLCHCFVRRSSPS